jgi:hypothetical protein
MSVGSSASEPAPCRRCGGPGRRSCMWRPTRPFTCSLSWRSLRRVPGAALDGPDAYAVRRRCDGVDAGPECPRSDRMGASGSMSPAWAHRVGPFAASHALRFKMRPMARRRAPLVGRDGPAAGRRAGGHGRHRRRVTREETRDRPDRSARSRKREDATPGSAVRSFVVRDRCAPSRGHPGRAFLPSHAGYSGMADRGRRK